MSIDIEPTQERLKDIRLGAIVTAPYSQFPDNPQVILVIYPGGKFFEAATVWGYGTEDESHAPEGTIGLSDIGQVLDYADAERLTSMFANSLPFRTPEQIEEITREVRQYWEEKLAESSEEDSIGQKLERNIDG